MPAEQLQTLNRAIAVLDCFSLEQPALGVREIARKLNVSSSSAGRLLASMKELGILTQNPETRAYSMGARVLSWAAVYNAALDVRNHAAREIEALFEETRETISLYVREGSDRVCIMRLETPQGVRVVARVGRRLPLYAGSAGKAMLAFLPVEEQAAVLVRPLEPLTSKTITDPAALQLELEKTRIQGCAVSFGEWIEDAAGVAAPIFDQDGAMIAAISISGPVQRFHEEAVARYCEEVKRVAARISEQMGYRAARESSSSSYRSVQHVD
jgi:DNA-binding IclR family transcriptional regulator